MPSERWSIWWCVRGATDFLPAKSAWSTSWRPVGARFDLSLHARLP